MFKRGDIVRTLETRQLGIVWCRAKPDSNGDELLEVRFFDFYAMQLDGMSPIESTSDDDRGWYDDRDLLAAKFAGKSRMDLDNLPTRVISAAEHEAMDALNVMEN